MARLTFSEFANLMYPYCGNGATQAEFVIALTDQIMKGRPARTRSIKEEEKSDEEKLDEKKSDEKRTEERYQNPIRDKSLRTLQAYYKGTRSISKGAASRVFASSDPYKFENYVRYQCSESGLSKLEAHLEKKLNQKITSKNFDIAAACAELFVEILHELASGKATE